MLSQYCRVSTNGDQNQKYLFFLTVPHPISNPYPICQKNDQSQSPKIFEYEEDLMQSQRGVPFCNNINKLILNFDSSLKNFFLMWTTFKVFTEFVIILLLFYVLVFLAMRHVGS